jgi:hypothetical protein
MTLYDILVPILALAFGGFAMLIVHLTDPDRKQSKKR